MGRLNFEKMLSMQSALNIDINYIHSSNCSDFSMSLLYVSDQPLGGRELSNVCQWSVSMYKYS